MVQIVNHKHTDLQQYNLSVSTTKHSVSKTNQCHAPQNKMKLYSLVSYTNVNLKQIYKTHCIYYKLKLM